MSAARRMLGIAPGIGLALRRPLALASLIVLALAVRPVAAQTEVIEYYGHDALGSIRIAFDVTGIATARADVEPFGELFTVPGMPGGSLWAPLFTGQERDPEASQDYFGARYYQPRVGRFSQVDPVFAGLFDPQQWNRYAYVRNNPLAFVDPDGRMVQGPVAPWDCPQRFDVGPAFCQLWGGGTDFGGTPGPGWLGWQFGQGGGGTGVDLTPKPPPGGDEEDQTSGDGSVTGDGNNGIENGNNPNGGNGSNNSNSSGASAPPNTPTPATIPSCASGVRVVGNLGEISIQSFSPGTVQWGVQMYAQGIGAIRTGLSFRLPGRRRRSSDVQWSYFGPGQSGWDHGQYGERAPLASGSEFRVSSLATYPPVRAVGTAACIVP